jgi:hypothetical protein
MWLDGCPAGFLPLSSSRLYQSSSAFISGAFSRFYHHLPTKKKRPDFSERPKIHQDLNCSSSFSRSAFGFICVHLRSSVVPLTLSYAFFVFKAFKAKVSLDLYRFAVFSVKVLFRIALSRSEKVAEASFSAVAVSPAVKAARIRLIDVRTRVRFMRLIAARCVDCRIFFNTDFVFFLCLIVVP